MNTDYTKLPTLLQSRNHWVLYDVPGAADPKHPRQAKHPQWGADSTNPATWADFATASAAVILDDANGMGYVLAKDDGLVFIDGDHCLDADGRPLSPFDKWLTMLPGYCERSRSGTGLHVIVRGTLPDGCKHKKHINGGEMAVELYDCNRYVALTGDLWGPQTPLADAPSAQAGIDAIIEQTDMLKGNGPADTLLEIDDCPATEVEAILQSALQRDLDFARLYTSTDHSGDESTADHALVCAACRAVNFKLSAGDLQRVLDASPWVTTKDTKHLHKWQDRTDYVPRTIREAWAASAAKEADKMDGFKAQSTVGDFFNAADLLQEQLPPVKWVVPGLLPAGLSLLVAAPKIGKSWMALDLCLAVASGGTWLGHEVNQGAVLYLALEDSKNRLQSRIRLLLDGFTPPPEACTMRVQAPMLGAGLLEMLDGWLNEHPDAKLVCIDTFQRIRPPAGKNENAYFADYRACGQLQAWAMQHGICLLLVHHTKKGVNPGDVFESISGSTGIMGAADTVLTITKKARFAEEATLSITGRDVNAAEYIAVLNQCTHKWELRGTVDDQERQNFQACPAVKTIKALTEQSPWQGTVTELADEVLTRYPDAPLPETAAGLRSYFGKIWPLLKSQGIAHKVKRDKRRLHVLERAK
mgnify:CR=1 FL=1